MPKEKQHREATDSKPVKPLAVLSQKTMKASTNSEESRNPARHAIDGKTDTWRI